MDRDMNPQGPQGTETYTLETTTDPAIQALLDRITELETKLATPASARTPTEPRAICKREHDASNWKVTPKGVRYCVLCYKELRLEQARKQLEKLGKI